MAAGMLRSLVNSIATGVQVQGRNPFGYLANAATATASGVASGVKSLVTRGSSGGRTALDAIVDSGRAARGAAWTDANKGMLKGMAWGTGLYSAGSATKSFSGEYQKTKGFQEMSSAGQGAFRASAWTLGTSLQVTGGARFLGAAAGRAGLTGVQSRLNSLTGGRASPGRVVAGIPGATKSTVKAVGNTIGNTLYGTGEVILGAAKTAAAGLVYGPGVGARIGGASLATMRNPYLGTAGAGLALGATKALSKPVKKESAQFNKQSSAFSNQAMQRGNYERVSGRARKMGV